MLQIFVFTVCCLSFKHWCCFIDVSFHFLTLKELSLSLYASGFYVMLKCLLDAKIFF